MLKEQLETTIVIFSFLIIGLGNNINRIRATDFYSYYEIAGPIAFLLIVGFVFLAMIGFYVIILVAGELDVRAERNKR